MPILSNPHPANDILFESHRATRANHLCVMAGGRVAVARNDSHILNALCDATIRPWQDYMIMQRGWWPFLRSAPVQRAGSGVVAGC